MFHTIRALFLVCVSAVPILAATSNYVVPVASARVKDGRYTTTLALRNESAVDVVCEAIYAIPNDPKGGTLRGTYRIPAGVTQIEEDVLADAGAIGTLRVDCSREVAIAARVQSSRDGSSFDDGRTFAGMQEEGATAHGALAPIRARGDVVIAEVAGKAVTVEAIVRDDKGAEFGRKTYDVPAFAHQIVNLSKAHAALGNNVLVEFHILAGNGAVVAAGETRDPALLGMTAPQVRSETRAALAVRTQPAQMSVPTPASSAIRSLGAAPFKGVPFQEPMTGLIYMRDRWYDSQTGSFLSPDPEGYRDSANLYSYCHGDPVNCSDPTGRLGDGGDLRADFREKENAERAKRFAAWCAANPIECRKVDVRGAGILRMFGGVGQTTAGVGAFASTGPLPEPVTKTLGGTAIVRGIDNTVTGAVEVWTGEPHDTMTGRALYLAMVNAGVSRATASRVTGWTETGVDLVSTAGSSLVPGVNTALRIRPVDGIINIGGTGEIPNASNLNPVLEHTGGRTIGIPNHVNGYGEQIGDVFAPNSARQVISRRLTFNTVNWQRVAQGAYSVLHSQGEVELNIYVSGLSRAEEAAFQADLVRQFTRAGFRNVRVQGSGPATFLLGTK